MAARPLHGEEATTGGVVLPLHPGLAGVHGFGASRAVGVVTALYHDSLTVHVRRGGPAGGAESLVTYRVSERGTRVYKGDKRTTLADLAVGDLVLVHAASGLPGEHTGSLVTAVRVHGLTPSRPEVGVPAWVAQAAR